MSAAGRGPFWARSPRRGGGGGSGGTGLGGTGLGGTGLGGTGLGGTGLGRTGTGSGGTGSAGTGSGRTGPGGAGSGGTRSPGGWGRSSRAFGSARGVLWWIWVRVAALLAVIVVVVGTVGFLLHRADGGPVAAGASSTGHDALWMGDAWLDGRRTPADLRMLAARIRGSGIGDVYVFVGVLDSAGRLAPAGYAGAGAFLASFRSACPGVRVSAWLGGVIGPGHINLGDPATRRHILAADAAVLHAGFHGVHYDLGPVASGDTGLLALLSETRGLHPGPLSLAVPKLEPLPSLRLPAQLVTRRPVFWTSGYLAQVASLADQVVVLSYDTGMPFQSWYGGYVERETSLALRAVPRHTGLLIGVPAYHNSDLGHHAGAETVAAAIHGIRIALTEAGGVRDRAGEGASSGGNGAGAGSTGAGGTGGFGVALFADYSATSQDWTSYLQDWVRPGSGRTRGR
jgi:hypothetical protein